MIAPTPNKINFSAVTQEETANKVIESDSSLVFTIKDGIFHCSVDGEEADILKAVFNFLLIDPRVDSLIGKSISLAEVYRAKAIKNN